MTRTHHLFISHSWAYGSSYNNLINLLRQSYGFTFKDYSVPQDNPIHNAGNDTQLQQAIKEQMSPCSAVIVLAGVYATYSKWINKEIDLAKGGFSKPKPVIAVRPWGNQRISQKVRDAADRLVGWNTQSIISAIKEVVP
ncbi:MAG: TIR domain-containing protein [Cyanobacteria bacterium MAG IRC1_bin_28]|nr:TIR domain-containing protein [Cyanobacteria bacterium MAG IRC1_bin_28]MYG63941.1 molecular chaperone Tir [Synechococcus sp. SB0675_bin_7]